MNDTANARFVYEQQIVKELDIAKAIGRIDKLIHESTKLQLSHKGIIVEFSLHPHDTDFDLSKLLIGREVLGYDTSVLSNLSFKDTRAQKVTRASVALHSDWDVLFDDIKECLGNVKKWRLIIDDNFSQAYIEY